MDIVSFSLNLGTAAVSIAQVYLSYFWYTRLFLPKLLIMLLLNLYWAGFEWIKSYSAFTCPINIIYYQ